MPPAPRASLRSLRYGADVFRWRCPRPLSAPRLARSATVPEGLRWCWRGRTAGLGSLWYGAWGPALVLAAAVPLASLAPVRCWRVPLALAASAQRPSPRSLRYGAWGAALVLAAAVRRPRLAW